MNTTNVTNLPEETKKLIGKSFFGATWEEFPRPVDRVEPGAKVLLNEYCGTPDFPAEVIDVNPGGRVRFADGEIQEGHDCYVIRVEFSTLYVIERHEFRQAL